MKRLCNASSDWLKSSYLKLFPYTRTLIVIIKDEQRNKGREGLLYSSVRIVIIDIMSSFKAWEDGDLEILGLLIAKYNTISNE